MTKHETTWDGRPISHEPPFGASVIVYRWVRSRLEFLILHRAHVDANDAENWAWTPPSGARLPDEPILECAIRELKEETGLALPLRATSHGPDEWAIYVAEAESHTIVQLDVEHDLFEWVAADIAVARCAPEVVSLRLKAVSDELSAV